MRLIDLPKIPEAIHRRLDARAHARGEEFANAIVNSTSQGRGLWVFILLPATLWVFMAIYLLVGVLANSILAGGVVGFAGAYGWWHLEFTRAHPFWSSVFAAIGGSIVLSLGLSGK